jgi:four helix bundle protein
MQTKDEKERGAIESGRALESVTAYRFAMEASDAAWDDASTMKCEPLLAEVAPQLIRAIGSVAANIAEGYARRSARDRIRFYEYALGSVEESRAWYQLARRCLAEDSLFGRLKRLDSMRRLLLVMIANERRGGEWNHRKS